MFKFSLKFVISNIMYKYKKLNNVQILLIETPQCFNNKWMRTLVLLIISATLDKFFDFILPQFFHS